MICNNFGICIGKKFDIKGRALKFEGNTIISILEKDSPVYLKAIEAQSDIKELGLNECVSFLPHESLHMTVIEGVCDKVRKSDYWTSFFPLEAPLKDIDDFFENEWGKIKSCPTIKMRFEKITCDSGIIISLSPNSNEDLNNIKLWRLEVSKKLGIKFPDFDNYKFHISLAYGLKIPNKDQLIKLENYLKKFEQRYKEDVFIFNIPSPSLTYFENMHYFNKIKIPRD